MRRDYAAAEEWATSADLQSNPIYHIVVTAILGQLGKAAEAEKERQWMEANAPEFLGNIRREVALRVLRPEDQASILDGLKKAGVIVPES